MRPSLLLMTLMSFGALAGGKKLNLKVSDFEKVFLLFSSHPYMAFSKSTSIKIVDKFKVNFDQMVKEGVLSETK